MRLKPFIYLCLALLFAPALMAQVPVPQRRMLSAGTNASPIVTNTPFHFPATPLATPNPIPSANKPAPAMPAMPAMPSFPSQPVTTPAATPAAPAAAIGPVAAAPKTNEVADIEYHFIAVKIEQLLGIYADLVGRTLLRATAGPEAVADTTTITLDTQSKLTHSEAVVALETILGMNGITVIPIGEKFAKIVTEANAGSAGGQIATNIDGLPLSGKFVTEIVQLKYVDPKDMVDVLTPFTKAAKSIIVIPSTGTLILRDYSENVARMMEMISRIDVLTPNAIKPKVIPIKYALASDIASALSALGASGGTSVGKQTSGANFRGGTGTTTGSGNGLGGGIGGQGGSYPGQAATTSGLGSAATSARSAFQQNLQQIVHNAAAGGSGSFQLFGQTKIIADERTNSLLVFANDDDMKMIEDIIHKLDVVLPQVLIDAIVMEINLTDSDTLGVSYGTRNGGPNEFSGIGGLNNLSSAASGFLTGTTTTNTGNAVQGGSLLANMPGGFSYFGKYGNDINLVLEAVAGNSRVNVLSRPRIQTSHAVQADLFIGNTVPYVTGTYNYGYGSGPSSQYTQLEVGIHLQVLPLINLDGLVVMDIQADVEQLGPPVAISGVGNVPTTTKRQAGAKVAVRNGETIILGGFISDSRTKSISGIPGLMNIPGLGNLFRSTSVQNLRTELIMLMRPTVLPTPEVAAMVATDERNKLPGVKQAELLIRKDETARNYKIERELADEREKEAAFARKVAEKALKDKKHGKVDTSTNTIPISTIPAIEDQ
jgi:general secretion pathway protein D